MLHHAHIWISTIKHHFPLVCWKTLPITVDCNCQSICTVTLLTVTLCEVLLLCLSSPPSACVVHQLSDVSLIHYIGCIPQVAHAYTHTHTPTHTYIYTHKFTGRKTEPERKERKRLREKDSKTFSLFSPRLWSYLFSEYVFQYIIPLWFLSIFHFGLSSITSQKVTSENVSLLSLTFCFLSACQVAERGGNSATMCVIQVEYFGNIFPLSRTKVTVVKIRMNKTTKQSIWFWISKLKKRNSIINFTCLLVSNAENAKKEAFSVWVCLILLLLDRLFKYI